MSDSSLRVNGRMHFRHVINRAKPLLEEQGEVRLEGIGISTSSLSVAVERLVTLGYAELQSISAVITAACPSLSSSIRSILSSIATIMWSVPVPG